MLAPSLPQSRYRRAVFWRDQAVKAGSQTLSGRLYAPASVPDNAGLVLHLHGGTFDSGSLASGEAVATTLAEAGAIVISLPYPLAPEARFPQALETAYAALEKIARDKARWVGKQAPLYVAGEEAGGNLAAALAMMARDRHGPPLAGQILFSPMLDACLGTYSFRHAEAGPVGCRWADGWHAYLGSPEKAAHPYATPANASRLSGLPPALIVSAEDDLLRDESVSYGLRLRAAGGDATVHVLDAPSHWPQALAEAPRDGSCLCSACHHISEFFSTTAPL
ncbi:alpha/beta hydrolase fold domain-containing protein [Bosea sp. WAO]|uniref:alpha/beta hydrolase fold domain-containing protein n=1 Tax=Bosea sp. WAO TaxID=406341 RepID=UPI0008307310|nr:alpha/beta hydrolase fold domain-containing protein [Bosea sp. WAO]